MLKKSHNHIAIGAVLMLSLLAGLHSWIGARRPVLSELRSSLEFVVTSSRDHGPGSLREAIFAADTASDRARIIFRVPFVELTGPLPPLANPAGIILEGPEEGAELRALGHFSGPLVDVNAANSVLRRIRIVNAPGQAILARSSGFHLLEVKISGCDVGLDALEGASGLVVEHSEFDGNRIGVRLEPQIRGGVLTNNQFQRHKDAGLWVVGSEAERSTDSGLAVRDNLFTGNRFGAVVGNTPIVVESNDFQASEEAAVLVLGQGAKVQSNRIRNGNGVGIFADRSEGTIIESNELGHNRAIGVLVRYSRDAVVRDNRVYANGYGIAFVLGETRSPSTATGNTVLSQIFDGIILIGDSPVLRGNQVVGSRQAGLRLLDFSPPIGNQVPSHPYLDNNALRGNQSDQPMRGEYQIQRTDK